MGKPTELMQLLKTGNSDAARKLIAKMKKSGKSTTENYTYIALLIAILCTISEYCSLHVFVRAACKYLVQ